MFITCSDNCASYEWLVRYRGHGHIIECDVYNHGDEYAAYIHIDGVEVGFAQWTQCEHMRHVYGTNIGKRYAWLCDVIRDNFGIIIPGV